jgi:asparagine synthase (glutamine-hydrolysing)
MCGIAGFIDLHSRRRDQSEELLRSMTNCLSHRGPDADGYWLDPRLRVGLGHRRLSIIDLSPAGAQPMTSASGRYTIIFNGEIYNFPDLRQELESSGHRFRGHSDTEVMLAAFEQWGINQGTTSLNGMFAFAVWDSNEATLTLARDRMGEKPLYYGWCGASFFFASELKALRAHPDFDSRIDPQSVYFYLARNNVPAPFSIYKSISKLEPGALLTVSPNKPGMVEISRYWDLRAVAASGVQNRLSGIAEEIADETERLLRDSIRRQMIADVPLGAFLSGGLDSATVVALMQAQSAAPVKTFTIGFDEGDYNEALYAREIARHLGTEHTELVLKPEEVLDIVPELPRIYDEPFSDSSQIPTIVVSRLARQHVTVALSGDAGDELFAGYVRYRAAADAWNHVRLFPGWTRRVMSVAGLQMSASIALQALVKAYVQKYGRRGGRRDQLEKAAVMLGAKSRSELYQAMNTVVVNPGELLRDGYRGKPAPSQPARSSDFLDEMMFEDQSNYLPGDILHKVDRAAMSCSLEVRIPLLDHRMVEHAWKIPNDLKVRSGVSKWLLRKIAYRYIPAAMLERPKSGFAVPIGGWLRKELRDWAEALLEPGQLRQQGYFNVGAVRERWMQHLSGKQNWEHQLWSILMFQAWLHSQRESSVAMPKSSLVSRG